MSMISIPDDTNHMYSDDEFLEKDVIRPSKATAWSQVHLVSGGWRFTIDYRILNKVITKKG